MEERIDQDTMRNAANALFFAHMFDGPGYRGPVAKAVLEDYPKTGALGRMVSDIMTQSICEMGKSFYQTTEQELNASFEIPLTNIETGEAAMMTFTVAEGKMMAYIGEEKLCSMALEEKEPAFEKNGEALMAAHIVGGYDINEINREITNGICEALKDPTNDRIYVPVKHSENTVEIRISEVPDRSELYAEEKKQAEAEMKKVVREEFLTKMEKNFNSRTREDTDVTFYPGFIRNHFDKTEELRRLVEKEYVPNEQLSENIKQFFRENKMLDLKYRIEGTVYRGPAPVEGTMLRGSSADELLDGLLKRAVNQGVITRELPEIFAKRYMEAAKLNFQNLTGRPLAQVLLDDWYRKDFLKYCKTAIEDPKVNREIKGTALEKYIEGIRKTEEKGYRDACNAVQNVNKLLYEMKKRYTTYGTRMMLLQCGDASRAVTFPYADAKDPLNKATVSMFVKHTLGEDFSKHSRLIREIAAYGAVIKGEHTVSLPIEQGKNAFFTVTTGITEKVTSLINTFKEDPGTLWQEAKNAIAQKLNIGVAKDRAIKKEINDAVRDYKLKLGKMIEVYKNMHGNLMNAPLTPREQAIEMQEALAEIRKGRDVGAALVYEEYTSNLLDKLVRIGIKHDIKLKLAIIAGGNKTNLVFVPQKESNHAIIGIERESKNGTKWEHFSGDTKELTFQLLTTYTGAKEAAQIITGPVEVIRSAPKEYIVKANDFDTYLKQKTAETDEKNRNRHQKQVLARKDVIKEI